MRESVVWKHTEHTEGECSERERVVWESVVRESVARESKGTVGLAGRDRS